MTLFTFCSQFPLSHCFQSVKFHVSRREKVFVMNELMYVSICVVKVELMNLNLVAQYISA